MSPPPGISNGSPLNSREILDPQGEDYCEKSIDRLHQLQEETGPARRAEDGWMPSDHVTPGNPPFSFVGLACFGPFVVRRGRSLVKRYGVLFTCLSIRAIHLEVAQSLDRDYFLNAMRRFIARRGQPTEIRSDNGGNFVRGERELREAIEQWNQHKINEFMLQRNVKWSFNPPAGSHHGGIWERCIRTVRKVIGALMKEQVFDDEGLATFYIYIHIYLVGPILP